MTLVLAAAQILASLVIGFIVVAVGGLLIAWLLALVVLLGVPALWGLLRGCFR